MLQLEIPGLPSLISQIFQPLDHPPTEVLQALPVELLWLETMPLWQLKTQA